MPAWAIVVACLLLAFGGALWVRLWNGSWRTGGTPLLPLAVGSLVAGCSLWVVRAALDPILTFGQRVYLSSSQEGLMAIGCAAVLIGAWKFYRPESRVAAWIAGGSALAVLTSWALLAVRGEPIDASQLALAPAMLSCGRSAAFGWWGTESVLYARKLTRRARIGLAQQEDAERFLWIGLGALLISAALASQPVCGWLLGVPPRLVPAALAFAVLVGASGLASLYCGMFLPRRMGALRARFIRSDSA